MRRTAKNKPNTDGEDQLGSQSKENISWAGNLDTLLAFQMRDEYHAKWKPGKKGHLA